MIATLHGMRMQTLGGKWWATVGFGSRHYARFCAAAQLFAQLASAAGTRALLRTGTCDADGTEEADFRAWAGQLLCAMREAELLSAAKCDALLPQVSLNDAVTTLGPEVHNIVPMPGLKHTKRDVSRFSAPVKRVQQLLGRASEDRSTCLVVLDLAAHPYLHYSPGDHLCVHPGNLPEVRRPQ